MDVVFFFGVRSIFHRDVFVAKHCINRRWNMKFEMYVVQPNMLIGIAIGHQGHSGNHVFSCISAVREIVQCEKE